jgi:hypothetical protein
MDVQVMDTLADEKKGPLPAPRGRQEQAVPKK